MKNQDKKPNQEDVLAKMMRFCAFRERCETEVKHKLSGFKLQFKEQSDVMKRLKEEGFFNDERFAKAFAKGKFSANKWGKIKISTELNARKIPRDFINNALDEIDDEKYTKQISKLLESKWKELKKEPDSRIRKNKTIQYLLSKGFSYQDIKNVNPDFESNELDELT